MRVSASPATFLGCLTAGLARDPALGPCGNTSCCPYRPNGPVESAPRPYDPLDPFAVKMVQLVVPCREPLSFCSRSPWSRSSGSSQQTLGGANCAWASSWASPAFPTSSGLRSISDRAVRRGNQDGPALSSTESTKELAKLNLSSIKERKRL
ncbi:hypothetical protein WJX73_001593 [Symbiochloris irregularis]|uniref:Uncharacterized protein n=1 Tax=Symbiochloris irregularis TaxID=706552 RepID=A0AAW1NMC6_9CHLO